MNFCFLKRLILPAMFLSLAVTPEARATASCLDVALVLSVDASASVSPAEFALQQKGIAAAFRDPEVLNAISMAGRVGVSAIFWGSEGMPKQQTGWTLVGSAADAERFARTLEGTPRLVTGDTGLGAGLAAALAKLEAPELCAVRKIINVSGDGADTLFVRKPRRSPTPSMVKRSAQALNVEINALAISNEEKDLEDYYSRYVITGPDAFVMEVRSYEDFATALRRKLIREIRPLQITGPAPGDATMPRPVN